MILTFVSIYVFDHVTVFAKWLGLYSTFTMLFYASYH